MTPMPADVLAQHTADLTDPPLPNELQVEVTAACNLRCHMCLVRYRPPVNRVTGSMDLETFRQLVDGNPNLERITLQGLGEPLLAPDLFAMVEVATARGIDVGFNTNGTLLTADKAERLVRSGLAWLHVSLDGADAGTYEAIRDGARFERVATNLRGLVEVKRRLGVDRPEVRVVFVAMRRNLDELPQVVRLAAEWGVGRVWVQNLSHTFDDCDPAGGYAPIRQFADEQALWNDDDQAWAERVFARARSLADDLGVWLRLPRLAEPEPPAEPQRPGCDWPWRSAYVTNDGQVQPCCMVMGADRAVLGEVGTRQTGDADGGFRRVWRSQPYQEFRRGLLDGNPPDVCRGCSMYRGVF